MCLLQSARPRPDGSKCRLALVPGTANVLTPTLTHVALNSCFVVRFGTQMLTLKFPIVVALKFPIFVALKFPIDEINRCLYCYWVGWVFSVGFFATRSRFKNTFRGVFKTPISTTPMQLLPVPLLPAVLIW